MRKETARHLIGLAGLALAAAAVACDPLPSGTGTVGIALSIDGQLVGRVIPCNPKALVLRVAVFDERDDTVWRIDDRRGSLRRKFTLGVVPPGFTEAVALGHLEAGKRYSLNVAVTGKVVYAVSYFVPGEMRDGSWWVGYKWMTDAEFSALKGCI